MPTVYLDTSGLKNIRLETDNLPTAIYVDGEDFINRLSQTLNEAQYKSPEEIKEQRRWELIVALASNPNVCDPAPNDPNLTNQNFLIKCADNILEQLESEGK